MTQGGHVKIGGKFYNRPRHRHPELVSGSNGLELKE